MPQALVTLAAILAISASTACNKSGGEASTTAASSTAANAPASGAKAYEAKGVIKSFGEGKKTVKIAHEDIPGYMKAMTMPFAVSSPDVLAGLAEGDNVQFSFTEENDGRMLIRSIKKQ